MSGIEKGEAELSSLTAETTGHKCSDDDVFEALVKQFREGEISIVIICEAYHLSAPPPPAGSESSQVALRMGK